MTQTYSNPEHDPASYVVTPPRGNARLEAMARALQFVEPELRQAGQVFDSEAFTRNFDAGVYNSLIEEKQTPTPRQSKT